MKKCRGITLIALVITIIVLLILAGVSLSLIAGEQGILGRATKASLQTEIAGLEEKANLIYADLSMRQYFDENASPEVTLAEIIGQLKDEKYQFKSEETAENAVTGISVQDMTLKVGETGSLNVILEGNSDGIAYYAQIRGEYYLITLDQNGVKVARTPTKIGNSGESKTLSATALPEGIVTIGQEAFWACESLKSITLPESLTYIGNQAFYNSGLESITFPETKVSLGENIFDYCESMEKVYVKETSAEYYESELEDYEYEIVIMP